jgi:hypothetical protein
MQIFCNYTLVQFPFFFSCSHRNKPADFAMGHFSFLQSLTTQACNHIPNNQVALQANRQSQVSIFATHITTGCNHVCRIVAITHWPSYFFSFFSKTHVSGSCNDTAIRAQAITYILVLQLSFFAIAAHQMLQPHVLDVAITCLFFTRLQPHQANTNLVAI